MDQILIELLKNSGPQSAVFIIGIYVLSKILKSDRGDLNSTAQDMKVDVKENAEAIQKLMIAITKLELQIENLTRIIAKTEKLEKDMHEAFSQIRGIKHRDA